MTYNLLVDGRMEPRVLTTVLSSIFHLSVEDVDVADSLGDVDRRNWEAAV